MTRRVVNGGRFVPTLHELLALAALRRVGPNEAPMAGILEQMERLIGEHFHAHDSSHRVVFLRLEQAGFVQIVHRRKAGPHEPSVFYLLTPAGSAALDAWVTMLVEAV